MGEEKYFTILSLIFSRTVFLAYDLHKYFIVFFPPHLLLGETGGLEKAGVREMPFPGWDKALVKVFSLENRSLL